MERMLQRMAHASALSALLALGACAPSITYPPRADSKLEVSDPNTNPAPKVMEVALERILDRYAPEGEYVVNLPQGMEKRWADLLLRRIDPEHALLVDAERTDLPTFHVTRVWVRPGWWAEVEVLRPMRGLAGVEGAPVTYEPVTVRLSRGGLGPWRVDSIRAWPGLAAEIPPLYGWPESSETRLESETVLTGADDATSDPEE